VSNSAPQLDAQVEQLGSTAEPGVDAARLAQLITTHYDGVLRLVRSKLRDSDLAADLINDAIVITLEHVRQGRVMRIDNVAGYVFKVSMNLLRNYRRNADNRPDLRADPAALGDLSQYDSDGIQTEQFRRQALDVLESLKQPRDREVIKRFYVDEHDKQVICADLALTPQQFTLVISRARERLRQMFESKGLSRTDFFSLLL
jgi:RNA polymerase sigma-70 factor, ECF subfamily